MTTRVFTLYNLRDGVDVEEFKKWSREVDQPTCASMPACTRFDVYLVQGKARDVPFFDVIEDIDVETWEAWRETIKSPAFARVAAEWPRYGDRDSVVSVFCERI